MTSSSAHKSISKSGLHLYCHESLASTQTLAREMHFESPGLVVRARRQTKGRGRQGRDWCSPAGRGLYYTMVLESQNEISSLSGLSIVAGMACLSVIRELLPTDSSEKLRLKWPNDLVFDSASGLEKLGGILTEVHTRGSTTRILVGVGVNLLGQFDVETQIATSLEQLGVREPVNEDGLFINLIEAMLSWIRDFEKCGFSPYIRLWRESGLGYAGNISVRLQNGRIISGRATGLNCEGALNLLMEDGESTLVYSGEIIA